MHDRTTQRILSHLPCHADPLDPEKERRLSRCVFLLKSEKSILQLQPLLIAFSERCGQSGTMQDLPYFLQKPGLLKRVPYLCLIAKREVASPAELAAADLLGALLLLEYRVFKVGTRSFATNDRSGRGSLLALPQDRMRVASQVCEVLFSRGAKVTMLSFLDDRPRQAVEGPQLRRLSQERGDVMWAMRQRRSPAYLHLCPTLDATMAGMGQKTRSNMRYYRRRAEKELGCTFVPKLALPVKDMLQFNRECMYPPPEATVRWRVRVMQVLHDPFLMGIKDREGRWLSVVAGRRFGNTSEILWQMNRAGYPAHSFGTVMRSYCIEHELQRGATRFQVEGGTFHSMHHSFEQEQVTDLVVVQSRSMPLVRKLVNRLIRPDNSLAEMFKKDDLLWQKA